MDRLLKKRPGEPGQMVVPDPDRGRPGPGGALRIGELMVHLGVITREQLKTALRRQEATGGGSRLGRQLIELGYITEDVLASTLASQLQLPIATNAAFERVPGDVIDRVPARLAETHGLFPLRLDGKRLFVAMADPSDRALIDELQMVTGCEIRPMVARESTLFESIDRYYTTAADCVSLTKIEALPEIEPAGVPRPSTPAAAPIRPGPAPTRPADDETDFSSVEPEGTPPPQKEAAVESPPSQEPRAEQAPAPERVPAARRPPTGAVPIGRVNRASRVGPPAGRLTLPEFGGRLIECGTQSELFDATLDLIGQDFARVALLVLKNGHLVGWRGQGDVNEQALRTLAVRSSAIPVIARALDDLTPRIGRGSAETLGPLVEALGAPGDGAMLVLPIAYAEAPVGCLVATCGYQGVEVWLDEYTAATEKLDFAMRILALRARILS